VIVAFTVSCLRQQYLRAALESWAKVRGVREATMLFALEPPANNFPAAEFAAFAARSFPGSSVHVADERLGCLRNTRRAAELALEREDFAVVAEEDLEVADDTLEYLAWARDAYAQDKDVAAVCAHTRASRLKDPAVVARAPWFSPLVWGTWRDRWENVIAPHWGPGDHGNPESWDLNLMLQVKNSGLASVFPARSRVMHCGLASTQTSWPLSEYFYAQHRSGCYTSRYGPQDYREIVFPCEPGVLVV
jgi:hypothetical protein